MGTYTKWVHSRVGSCVISSFCTSFW